MVLNQTFQLLEHLNHHAKWDSRGPYEHQEKIFQLETTNFFVTPRHYI